MFDLKDLDISPEEVMEMTQNYMMETYERFPFVAVKAKNMYLYDSEGHSYLDFYGGIAVNNAGSCNDKVVEAVQEQVANLIHTFNYPYTIPQAVLAKLICETIGMDKIFFQNSGTEANEAMIKLARKYGIEKYGPNKYHIVTAKSSFHGRTYGAMSATGQPDNACQNGFKPMLEGFTYAEFNNLKSFQEACTEDTIAIMVEPCQGEGGVHPATQEFLKGLREFCDEKEILLLLDEIQTGWCRTGKVMDYMNYNVLPDMVTMAKGMGGGMPIGAMCCNKEVAKFMTKGAHGSTYAGNPVCCAASYAQINELIQRNLAENAKNMGEYFAAKLRVLTGVKEVRHAGLLVGVELELPLAVAIKHECTRRKLLVTAIGDSIIRMVPPLIVNEQECDMAVEILEDSIVCTTETNKI